MGFPCQATIDLRALRANLGLARELAGRREVIAVVKADGYGHGAVSVARALVESGNCASTMRSFSRVFSSAVPNLQVCFSLTKNHPGCAVATAVSSGSVVC